MGLKAAFNKFKTPPLVPSDMFVWGDVLVLLFVVLNTADFLTDLLVLVSFAEEQEWLFFWLCLPFLLIYPLVLLIFEREFHETGPLGSLFIMLMKEGCFETSFVR